MWKMLATPRRGHCRLQRPPARYKNLVRRPQEEVWDEEEELVAAVDGVDQLDNFDSD